VGIPGKLRRYEVNTFWDLNFPCVLRRGRRWYFLFGVGAITVERLV